MSKEIELSAERIHPNEVINNAVTYYVLQSIEQGLFVQKPDIKISTAVIEHLANAEAFVGRQVIPSKDEFKKDKDLIVNLAESAFEAYINNQSAKDTLRGKFDPRLIAYAPQALLFYSYLPLFDNLAEVAHGKKVYGFKKELDRLQPHNAIASGEMLKFAAKNIAQNITKNLKDVKIDNVLELGGGNAIFSQFVSEIYPDANILVTDINPKTRDEASKTLIGKKHSWMEVDMGNINNLNSAANTLNGTTLLHIGYILHENRQLAQKTLSGISEVFKGKDVVFAFSEYYSQDVISPEVPLWFQTIHEMTQDLFKREELINFVEIYGLKMISEVEHNRRKDSGQIMNSTTFWKS